MILVIFAATAIESDVELLHNDRDFDYISAHSELTVRTGSGRSTNRDQSRSRGTTVDGRGIPREGPL